MSEATPPTSSLPPGVPERTPAGGIPKGSGEDDALDVARGELNDDDLAQLEAAIDAIDFATRKATADRQARLDGLLARLQDVTEQIKQGVRKPAAERAPLTDEQKARWQAAVDEGVSAGERGDLVAARAKLEEAARLDPDGLEGLFNLGVVYGLMAHRTVAKADFYDDYTRDEVWTEKAKLCYDRCLERDPKHLPSLKNLATLYAMRDERDLAVELLKKIVGSQGATDDEKALIDEAKAQLAELESI